MNTLDYLEEDDLAVDVEDRTTKRLEAKTPREALKRKAQEAAEAEPTPRNKKRRLRRK